MERLEILKTYKIYIGGQFPRTESGRFYPLKNKEGKLIANVCLSSRKDVKNAVVAARKAQAGWGARAPFNRSQILYRIAEMMEGRKSLLTEECMRSGLSKKDAENEVYKSIDRVIYYAGWCDKYGQIFSSVNPVSSPHFNFSALEPMGVVGVLPHESSPLLGLMSALIPVIAGGNAALVIADEKHPLVAITMAEVINDSDVPGGVVNILTGKKPELLEHLAGHMDVNAITYYGDNQKEKSLLQEISVNNLKRVFFYQDETKEQNPYFIADLQEVKTTWHPIEIVGASGSGY